MTHQRGNWILLTRPKRCSNGSRPGRGNARYGDVARKFVLTMLPHNSYSNSLTPTFRSMPYGCGSMPAGGTRNVIGENICGGRMRHRPPGMGKYLRQACTNAGSSTAKSGIRVRGTIANTTALGMDLH